jgi:hypothetical protein
VTAEPTTPSPESPSLRRVLAGYLRLRSPYNLCLDAAIFILVSYFLTSIRNWLYITLISPAGSRPVQRTWAAKEALDIAIGSVYYMGLGVFFIALARMIADRIGPDTRQH